MKFLIHIYVKKVLQNITTIYITYFLEEKQFSILSIIVKSHNNEYSLQKRKSISIY